MKKTIGLGWIKRMPYLLTVLSPFVVVIISVICPCIIFAQTFEKNSATLTNEYLSMRVGDKLIYNSYNFIDLHYLYCEALYQETIDQIKCLKIKISLKNYLLSYFTNVNYYWLAQDTSGTVWILQYQDVELNDLRYFGRNNAKVFMPSKVTVGSSIWNPDVTETVVATGVNLPELSTGRGPYFNCIKSKIDYGGGDLDYNYYAPNVGQVKIELNDDGGINGFEISEISHRLKSKSTPWLPLLLDD